MRITIAMNVDFQACTFVISPQPAFLWDKGALQPKALYSLTNFTIITTSITITNHNHPK